jgi:hypothetical protein
VPERVTLDLVTYDGANDEYVLYLVEEAPWPESGDGWHRRLKMIQDRILAAVDVAVDGLFAGKYPDSRGKAIRVQIDSPSGCPDQLAQLVSAVSEFVTKDASYVQAIAGSEFVTRLRIVTGAQMGRFRRGTTTH